MLGIDVSKDTLSCVLIDAVTRQRLWHKDIPNTEAGWRRLLALTPPETSWVLEPTGRYSTGVARAAKQQGRTVLLAEPRQARSYLISISPRAKTDALDALGLALYGVSRPLRLYPVLSETMERLKQLLCARKSLSHEIARLSQQRKELPLAKDHLNVVIQAVQASRKALDREIAAGLKTSGYADVSDRLMAVPGIGPITAATVIVRVCERSFASADAFVAYIGLDITVHQSGKNPGKGRLSHRGDAEMRRLFHLAAQSNLTQAQSPFKAQYERERAKGLASTAALCAVARKLARLCWSLVTHNTTYDPLRIYNQRYRTSRNDDDTTILTTTMNPPLDKKP